MSNQALANTGAVEVQYLISEVMPSLGVTSSATIEGLSDVGNPLVPKQDPSYVYNKDLVIDIRSLYLNPFTEGLCIFGHAGTGKTSGVLQYMAATKRPVRSITANGRMTADDLIGFHALVSAKPGSPPEMRFNYGPLPLAMKEGSCLLINEVDMIEPSELAALNDVLEGRPLIIASNGGELVHPHPDFRIIVTANSSGGGDETGFYQGVKVQNLASLDRYRFSEVGYLAQELELKILEDVAPKTSKEILKKMVSVANGIRQLFMGDANNPGSISVPMSTRTLVRWAKLMQSYAGTPDGSSLVVGFNKAFLLRVNGAEKAAIERVAADVFGKDWAKTTK